MKDATQKDSTKKSSRWEQIKQKVKLAWAASAKSRAAANYATVRIGLLVLAALLLIFLGKAGLNYALRSKELATKTGGEKGFQPPPPAPPKPPASSEAEHKPNPSHVDGEPKNIEAPQKVQKRKPGPVPAEDEEVSDSNYHADQPVAPGETEHPHGPIRKITIGKTDAAVPSASVEDAFDGSAYQSGSLTIMWTGCESIVQTSIRCTGWVMSSEEERQNFAFKENKSAEAVDNRGGHSNIYLGNVEFGSGHQAMLDKNHLMNFTVTFTDASHGSATKILPTVYIRWKGVYGTATPKNDIPIH